MSPCCSNTLGWLLGTLVFNTVGVNGAVLYTRTCAVIDVWCHKAKKFCIMCTSYSTHTDRLLCPISDSVLINLLFLQRWHDFGLWPSNYVQCHNSKLSSISVGKQSDWRQENNIISSIYLLDALSQDITGDIGFHVGFSTNTKFLALQLL